MTYERGPLQGSILTRDFTIHTLEVWGFGGESSLQSQQNYHVNKNNDIMKNRQVCWFPERLFFSLIRASCWTISIKRCSWRIHSSMKSSEPHKSKFPFIVVHSRPFVVSLNTKRIMSLSWAVTLVHPYTSRLHLRSQPERQRREDSNSYITKETQNQSDQ